MLCGALVRMHAHNSCQLALMIAMLMNTQNGSFLFLFCLFHFLLWVWNFQLIYKNNCGRLSDSMDHTTLGIRPRFKPVNVVVNWPRADWPHVGLIFAVALLVDHRTTLFITFKRLWRRTGRASSQQIISISIACIEQQMSGQVIFILAHERYY